MRTKTRLGLLFTFLIFGLSIRVADGVNAEISPTEYEAVLQRSLYVQNCARCHGLDGRGQTALGIKLEAADLTSSYVKEFSNEKIIRVINNGGPDMPAFRKKLAAKKIASIAGYVRRL